jgi:predicted nuclease of predicted toxin-antitoxin system
MRLFAKLYFDEDVSALVAVLLQARGFGAVTARDADMLGQNDPKQLAHAITQERCMVTHNRVHFERLHQQYATTGQEHHGIMLLHDARRRRSLDGWQCYSTALRPTSS